MACRPDFETPISGSSCLFLQLLLLLFLLLFLQPDERQSNFFCHLSRWSVFVTSIFGKARFSLSLSLPLQVMSRKTSLTHIRRAEHYFESPTVAEWVAAWSHSLRMESYFMVTTFTSCCTVLPVSIQSWEEFLHKMSASDSKRLQGQRFLLEDGLRNPLVKRKTLHDKRWTSAPLWYWLGQGGGFPFWIETFCWYWLCFVSSSPAGFSHRKPKGLIQVTSMQFFMSTYLHT